MSYGYVYVLANESLPYVKIGKTKRSPEERAKELTTTGVPTPFKVAYKVYVEDCDSLEKSAHHRLHKYRVRNNREFFEVDLTVAVSTIEELTAKSTSEDEESTHDFDPLKYVQNLVENKETSIAESKIAKELGLERAHSILNEVMSYLTPLNGWLDSNGLEIIFELVDESTEGGEFNHYCESPLAITVSRSIIELPKGAWVDPYMVDCIHYYASPDPDTEDCCSEDAITPEGGFKLWDQSTYLASDIKDPRKLAKKIISDIDWATEKDAEKRRGNNFPIEQVFERVRKILVYEWAKGIGISDLGILRHWSCFKVVVQALEETNDIAPITAKSWLILANNRFNTDWNFFDEEMCVPKGRDVTESRDVTEDMHQYIRGLGWGAEFSEGEKRLYPRLNMLEEKLKKIRKR